MRTGRTLPRLLMMLIRCTKAGKRQRRFVFVGDSVALDSALKNFAAIKADRLTIVLVRGQAAANLSTTRIVQVQLILHLLGGVSRMMAKKDLGSNIGDRSQPACLCRRCDELDEIRIPEGVDVFEISDLQKRYPKCLNSTDRTVRGCELRPYC